MDIIPRSAGTINQSIAPEQSEHYRKLRPCYVIFICTFDPLGAGLYLYTVKRTVQENTSIKYEDGDYSLYFNTKGTVGEIPEPMKEILKYINDPESYPVKETEVDVIKKIDEAVRFNQHSPEWRAEYKMFMTTQMDAEFWGEKRGEIRGEERAIRRTAKNLIELEVPLDQIVQATKLDIEELVAMRDERQVELV
jgi:predicted transposase/invertase (TIGR01784 family)